MSTGGETFAAVVKFAVPAVSAVALVTDVARGRIFNWLTLPVMAIGVIAAGALGGWSVLGQSLLGVLAGLVLYGWMFWLGAMGGGDVKFLMALGAWGGPRFVLETGILAVLLGGVFGLVVMIFTGRIVGFAKRMHRFLLSIFVKDLAVEVPRIDRGFTMPFGVPIAVAAVWALFGEPLAGWLL